MRFSFLLCLLAALAPRLDADVITVGGGGDFDALQPAVDAAFDGDVLLLADGDFGGALIVDKALSIVADAGATPRVLGVLAVEGLAAGKTCLLAGLEVATGFLPGVGTVTVSGLRIEFNDGAVFVEDCTVFGRGQPVAATVRFNQSVAFVNCTLIGADGLDCADAELCGPGEGVDGIFVRASQVTLSGGDVDGGRGGSYTGDAGGFAGVPADGGDGGEAIEVASGSLHVVASALDGGVGGGPNCTFSGCGSPGIAGRSIELTSSAASVSLQQVALSSPVSNPGGGPVVVYPATARRLEAHSPVREGETLGLDFLGEPGDQLSLWIGFDAGFVAMPARQGVFQLALPLALPSGANLGTLPGTGAKTVELVVPPFPGLDGFPLFLQGVFVSPTDGALLGTAASTVALSAGL